MTDTNKNPVFRLVVTVLAVIGAIAVLGAVGMAVMHTTMMGGGWGC
mgnify:FL=1|jgi:hypothetical protein